jgi:uncharacterized membrane protein
MNSKKQITKKGSQAGKTKKTLAIAAGVIVILIIAVLIVKGSIGNSNGTTVSSGGDLTIQKSEITETAKFYPYNAGGTNLEILAVKAADGSIRTAFNTCQVCNGSPRAYYKQQGDVLICQNCGNRFEMDMIEQERGGCNPIPIMKDEKTDGGTNIIISEDFIVKNKNLFTANWKTR